MARMSSLGLYVHIPFCRAKCAYCDFNSYAGLEAWFDRHTDALIREIVQAGSAAVKTIYIGGGTPSVLPLSLLSQILDAARGAFNVEPGAEISIEANPGTTDTATLSGLRALGVNRLSLGVQSLNDEELKLLGRIHAAGEAVEAFGCARQAGFDNVNLDLIYGLPGQEVPSWRATLERALALQPEHLSCYALSVEGGTPLARAIARGELPEPDPDVAADMYELAEGILSTAGYVHYEISNWAAGSAFQCQHNLVYWRNEPYLGVGAGAHSWADGRRWANVASPVEYATRMLAEKSAVAMAETIDHNLEIGETMMMGLRLLDEGVEHERFRTRFGMDLRRQFSAELEELEELGLIAVDAERVRLSECGRLLGNRVFAQFLPDT